MIDTPAVDLPSKIRADQKELLNYIARAMGVSVSAVVRWAIDDARPFLLARASLQETDLPQETQRAA